MSESPATYGPSALKTWANGVTIARLLASPGLLVLIAQEGATWGVFALWTGLALTDGLDGWIARRQGTTRSGAFLDPLADKVRANVKPCAECHETMRPEGTLVDIPEAQQTTIAAAYMDALHTSCMGCH